MWSDGVSSMCGVNRICAISCLFCFCGFFGSVYVTSMCLSGLYYGVRIIVCGANGVYGLSYVWNVSRICGLKV